MGDAVSSERYGDGPIVEMTPAERASFWFSLLFSFALAAMPLTSILGRLVRGQSLHELWSGPSGRETILLPLVVTVLMWAVLVRILYRMFRRKRKYGRFLPAGDELLAYRQRMNKPIPIWLHALLAAFMFSGAIWLTGMMLGSRDRSAIGWLPVALLWLGASLLVLGTWVRAFPRSEGRVLTFFVLLMGKIDYVEISSPKLETRIRARYQSDMEELATLDFSLLFLEGETFPVMSLLLVFPAIVLIAMWRKHEVFAVHGGSRILIGQPILASADKSAYANVTGLGVKFRTRFHSGRILESKNNGEADDEITGPMFVRRVYPGSSIAETWHEHQGGVSAREEEGEVIDRELNFDAWETIVRQASVATFGGPTKNVTLAVEP
jgi:hypothetical protein